MIQKHTFLQQNEKKSRLFIAHWFTLCHLGYFCSCENGNSCGFFFEFAVTLQANYSKRYLIII